MDYDANLILKRLENGEKIVGTRSGTPFFEEVTILGPTEKVLKSGFPDRTFSIPDRTFWSTSDYKIFKGNRDRIAIYYQYGRSDFDYVLYFLEDYKDTWAFSEDEIIQHFEALKTEAENMSLTEKVKLLRGFESSGQDFFVPKKWRHYKGLIFDALEEHAKKIDASIS